MKKLNEYSNEWLDKLEERISLIEKVVDYIESNNIYSKLELTEYEKKCLFCKHNYKPFDCMPRCNCMCEDYSDFKCIDNMNDIKEKFYNPL